jgi:two-component system, cell cycle response regulator DivK
MSLDPHEATILVVEDNPDNLFIVLEILRSKLRVRYCAGVAIGQQLFSLIAARPEQPVDMILLDLQLPYEDGYTMLRRIREQPELAATLVVAMTANVIADDVERARAAGFDGFLGKPIDLRRFPGQITRILGGEVVWEPR